MTRRFTLVALWISATALAVLMASFAVRLVGNNVVAEGPPAVTRGEVTADLADIAGTTTTGPPATSRSEATPSGAADVTQSTTSIEVVEPPTVAAPTPTSPPPTVASRVEPPISSGDVSAPSSTAAPPPVTAASSVEQSYPLVGGSVRVSCAGTASLVSSSPNPGYSMEVRENGPERVEVRFIGASHTSELKAWCSGGSIVAEPKESGQGGDG